MYSRIFHLDSTLPKSGSSTGTSARFTGHHLTTKKLRKGEHVQFLFELWRTISTSKYSSSAFKWMLHEWNGNVEKWKNMKQNYDIHTLWYAVCISTQGMYKYWMTKKRNNLEPCFKWNISAKWDTFSFCFCLSVHFSYNHVNFFVLIKLKMSGRHLCFYNYNCRIQKCNEYINEVIKKYIKTSKRDLFQLLNFGHSIVARSFFKKWSFCWIHLFTSKRFDSSSEELHII